MTEALTIDIDEPVLRDLEVAASRLGRTREAVAHEAIESWLAVQRWQMQEIEAGIADADAGRFAADDEVEAVFARHGVTR